MGLHSVHTLVGVNHIITSNSRLGISSAELLASSRRYVVFVSQGYSSVSRGQTWEQSQIGYASGCCFRPLLLHVIHKASNQIIMYIYTNTVPVYKNGS